MPVIECSGCHKKLRVPDENAGKRAKCPDCGTIFVFPHTSVWLTPGYSVMLGTESPLAIDFEHLQQRVQSEPVRASLDEVELGDPSSYLAALALEEEGV